MERTRIDGFGGAPRDKIWDAICSFGLTAVVVVVAAWVDLGLLEQARSRKMKAA